jgi:hypothetical protein
MISSACQTLFDDNSDDVHACIHDPLPDVDLGRFSTGLTQRNLLLDLVPGRSALQKLINTVILAIENLLIRRWHDCLVNMDNTLFPVGRLDRRNSDSAQTKSAQVARIL